MAWSSMSGIEKALAIIVPLAGVASAGAAWIGGIPQINKWVEGFDPHITIGSIAIAKAPTKIADNKIALFLDVRISNSSNKGGCLSDFAIRLRDIAGSQADKWFFPVFFVDINKFVDQARTGPDTSASIDSSFSAIYMSAASSVEREIAFMHRPHTNEGKDIMTVESLIPSSYQAELLVSTSGLPCVKAANYKLVFDAPIFFKLSESLISEVRKGSLVHPADADLDQRRETLMRSTATR
jgi:hypothetical protein